MQCKNLCLAPIQNTYLPLSILCTWFHTIIGPWYEKETLNWSKATSRHLHNTFSTLTGQADYFYIFMVSSAMQFWQNNCSHMSGWVWHALVNSVHLKRERLSYTKGKYRMKPVHTGCIFKLLDSLLSASFSCMLSHLSLLPFCPCMTCCEYCWVKLSFQCLYAPLFCLLFQIMINFWE